MAYMNIDRDYLVADLKAHCIEFVFDHPTEGTRVVIGTLQPSWFPEEYRKPGRIDEIVSGVDIYHVPVLDIKANKFFRLPLNQILTCQVVNY